MILKDVPKAEWPILRLKVMAAAALGGRRSDWGSRRKWDGNYLAMVKSLSKFRIEFIFLNQSLLITN